MGGWIVRHARRIISQLAEVAVSIPLFYHSQTLRQSENYRLNFYQSQVGRKDEYRHLTNMFRGIIISCHLNKTTMQH